MKAIRELRAIAFVLVAASVVGCSDSSTGPDRAPADLGVVLNEMTLSSVASGLVPGVPSLPSASVLTPSSCSYDSGAQNFACPTVTVSGLTFTRSFALLSASGTPQPQFDPSATAAVRTNSSVAGTITTGGTSMTVDGHDVLTLSGILTGVHMLDGTSVLNVQGTEAGSTTPYTLSVSTTIASLVLPASAADRWPKSGKVMVDLTDSMQGTTTTAHMAMTFNGTSKVAVTMTSGGLTLSCTVDLAAQSPSCS